MRRTSKEAELLQLSQDAGIITFTPKIAYFAESEEDVAVAVREASANGLSVTPRGGGTSIPSQSVGRGAILLQDRKLVLPMPDRSVVCQPNLLKGDLNDYLGHQGRWVPVDPSSYASCTIGGMVANNSSGARTLKYGSTIDYVTRLRVVIPGGEAEEISAVTVNEALESDVRTRAVASLILENQKLILRDKPRVTKNSSGYRLERVLHDGFVDFPKLFVGSEGTLGVLTQVALETREKPSWRLLFIVECTLEELDDVAKAFREHSPAALELVDKSVFRSTSSWGRVAKYSRSESPYLVFCELDGDKGDSAAVVEGVGRSKAGSYDPVVLSSLAEVAEVWAVRNESLTLAQGMRRGTKVVAPGVEDLVVPPNRLGDLVKLLVDQFERRGLEYISYGHAGDANLHARPLLDLTEPGQRAVLDELMEDCFEKVWAMGGSMTGEHGDGMLRAKYVAKQYPRTHWIMREVKDLFDPKGILNPGVKIV
jgi:glycolate dehydrogenase FAD-linked subunit